MGILVSAAEAGALVGRHERIVRWHIGHKDTKSGAWISDLPARKVAGKWAINTDDLSRVPDWTVDRERLAKLELRQSRTHSGLVARVEALEQRMRGLEAHIRALETAITGISSLKPPAESSESGDIPEDWIQDALRLVEAVPTGRSVVEEFPARYRGPATVKMRDHGTTTAPTFDSRADAARWLVRHGVQSDGTPKSWPGWRHVELSPRAVLALALDLQQRAQALGDWRVAWRLHHCADASCVCQELLGSPTSPQAS